MWGIAGVGDVQQSQWQQQQRQRRQCVHAAVINESPGPRHCSINTRCVRIHYAECVGTPSTAVHATPSSNGVCEDTLQKAKHSGEESALPQGNTLCCSSCIYHQVGNTAPPSPPPSSASQYGILLRQSLVGEKKVLPRVTNHSPCREAQVRARAARTRGCSST